MTPAFAARAIRLEGYDLQKPEWRDQGPFGMSQSMAQTYFDFRHANLSFVEGDAFQTLANPTELALLVLDAFSLGSYKNPSDAIRLYKRNLAPTGRLIMGMELGRNWVIMKTPLGIGEIAVPFPYWLAAQKGISVTHFNSNGFEVKFCG